MENLNKFARKYLDENGIKISYFADWIGCDRTQVGRWLSGQRALPQKYIRTLRQYGSYNHSRFHS